MTTFKGAANEFVFTPASSSASWAAEAWADRPFTKLPLGNTHRFVSMDVTSRTLTGASSASDAALYGNAAIC